MSLLDSISNLRRDYSKGKFDITNAIPNPFEQFRVWFDEALHSQMLEPTAMVVSTVSQNQKPSSRVVLLKNYDDTGFVFFTNYESRKGQEIQNNSNAAILFYWDFFERQIRIEGTIEKVNQDDSEAYFNSRPYESKIGAWASKQSQPLSSRFSLIRDVVKLIAKYPKEVPLPEFWGGYKLSPDYFEFWQGRQSRLHDRITYTKTKTGWDLQRLYP